MKIYLLKVHCCDISSGTHTDILAIIKNGNQVNNIKNKLNKKYGYSNDVSCLKFYVKTINTNSIAESLTQDEIKNLWE